MSGLALTFDDGPDPEWTPRLLDLLDHVGAKATFFPIASRAAAQPALIARVREAGHAIGLHCHEHVRHSTRDRAWLESDTREALRLLAQVDVRPSLWRTPWGDTAGFSAEVAAEHHLGIVSWTLDTHDWRGDSAEMMLADTQAGIVEDAIVLAHDGIGPGAKRDGMSQTVRYVERAASLARRRGLRLEALR
ncbi:MAG TPA: polysaccharide deacetylase family protein [Solirubrobacteraceae bacterium]|nr:polysaccharide deacetylase family protein [Solirubrobacteraceae bacterium]